MFLKDEMWLIFKVAKRVIVLGCVGELFKLVV